MLNKVILMGRITQDLEVRQSQSGMSVLRFNVAVDRFTKQGAEKQTDFISCVAFGQNADFINRYFSKGRMIAIEGNIKTGSYDDKNGVKRYTTDVVVERTSFTGERNDGGNQGGGYQGGYNNNQNNFSSNNQQPQNNFNNASSNDALNIGDMDDFEVLSGDGVPF